MRTRTGIAQTSSLGLRYACLFCTLDVLINQQWRICFEWPQGADGPENVEIVDYH